MEKIDRENINKDGFLTESQVIELNNIEDDDLYRVKAMEFFMDNVNSGQLFDGVATVEMTIE